MIHFDIQTAYLIVGLLYMILPVTAWIILAGQHSRAVAFWCGGGLIYGFGLLLIGLREHAWDWISFPLANAFILLGSLGRIQALRLELAVAWRRIWPGLAAALVYALIYEGIRLGLDHAALRHQFTSLVQASLLLYLVTLAWRLGVEQHSHSARWIAGAYLLVAVTLVVRVVFLAAGWGAVEFIETSFDLVLLTLVGVLAAVVGHVGYVGVFLERTLQQQIETAARQASDQRLAALIGQGIVGVVEADLDGHLLRFNDRYCELIGYPREGLAGRRWQELGLAEDVQVNESLLQALPSDDVLPTIERCHRHADGKLVWLSVSGAVIRDTAGRPASTLGVASDITQLKQAEERLRASERRFRELFEHLPLAYQSLDARGCFVDANQALAELLGVARPEDLWGRSFGEFWSPENEHNFDQCFQHFQATQSVLSEMSLSRQDGQRVTVMLAGRVQLDEVGRFQRTHCILLDISQRRAMEEEIRRWSAELEQKVAQRTAELAAANAAKSDFLAAMSHEIRTPMNGVIGMTGLLLATDLNAEQRRFAETIHASGQALLTLLNEILDLSKIEAGRLELEAADFDLLTLLDEVGSSLALRAQEKGLEFICAAAPDVPPDVCGDSSRLRQILINLASNAVKFTERGEVSVLASVAAQTASEILLRLDVRDTGIGIPPHQQERLFEKFTQADATIARRFGGSGLGLVIAKNLVELMGGEIGLTSQPGVGSQFWCTVRLARSDQPLRSGLAYADFTGQRVLLVDDNATYRGLQLAQLTAWGLRAEAAVDGTAALHRLRQARDAGEPFRVALIDGQMPGTDGGALARQIQADPALRGTRLVLLRTWSQRAAAAHPAAAADEPPGTRPGVACCLTKPVRQAELRACLAALLADTAPAPPAPASNAPLAAMVERRGARILVAEDNEVNQQVALSILRKLGLHADAVDNGAQAIAALTASRYDLVLMDVQMPELDGLEATRLIRQPQADVRDHAIPIVAMTAAAMPGDRERCLAAGMNDYTTKPVSPEGLIHVLNRWLPQEPAAAVAPAPEDRGRAGERPTLPPEAAATAAAPTAPAPGAPPDELPIFDRAGVLERLADEELVELILDRFLETAPAQLASLRSLLDAGDAAGAERQAHSLKGAAANVGGQRLRRAAFAAEQAARARDLPEAAGQLDEMELEFARFQAAVQGKGPAS